MTFAIRRPAAALPSPRTMVLTGAAAALLLVVAAQRGAETYATTLAPAAPASSAAFEAALSDGRLVRSTPPTLAAAPAARPLTYVVRPGDTLATIAAALYGDAALAPRIAAANAAALDSSARVSPGQGLLIPSL
ncbi:LysM peptidoglycan-binding domain-containing protein [Roseisalinus antarcticus]|uniref:LysM domain/BON superfamily protein n=1 Tax=Roseisalinus antarcticus TaxID=254357 RepID=A0A1Y5T8F2_9RHOB|nr:LysM domain-containing protein [Roseisalinus antarcticus]SLN58206.1 LysM domain/BON superfamily protein [Roseisalinus antarcticus]